MEGFVCSVCNEVVNGMLIVVDGEFLHMSCEKKEEVELVDQVNDMKKVRCKYCNEPITSTNLIKKTKGYHARCLVKIRKEKKLKDRKLIDKIKDYITKIIKYVFDQNLRICLEHNKARCKS